MEHVRPLFSRDDYVCDLKFVMRTRLFLGYYNNMYTPKKLQMWAKIYCFIITICILSSVIHFCATIPTGFHLLYDITKLLLISANMLCSLYTADSYVTKLCTRANFTDSTLTPAPEFLKTGKILTYLCGFLILMKTIDVCMFLKTFPTLKAFLFHVIPVYIRDLVLEMRVINQFLVLSLMYCRIAILRRKIERLGFRHVRNAKYGLNVYCEMYFRTLNEMNESTNPMKVLMLFDLMCNSAGIIFLVVQIFQSGFTQMSTNISFKSTFFLLTSIVKMIAVPFTNGFIVDATAAEVDIIQTLVVEELMQSSVEEERRAIYNLLELVAALPARVSLFRVADVDAALALAVLGACTQRIVALIQTFQ